MSHTSNISNLGLTNVAEAHWNLSPEELTKITVESGEGKIFLQSPGRCELRAQDGAGVVALAVPPLSTRLIQASY